MTEKKGRSDPKIVDTLEVETSEDNRNLQDVDSRLVVNDVSGVPLLAEWRFEP